MGEAMVVVRVIVAVSVVCAAGCNDHSHCDGSVATFCGIPDQEGTGTHCNDFDSAETIETKACVEVPDGPSACRESPAAWRIPIRRARPRVCSATVTFR